MRSRILIALAAALTICAAGIGGAMAAQPSTPTLGPPGAEYQTGFGKVKPSTISYGGDETSLVSHVKWSSWGAAKAEGHGSADWIWPGWCTACGGVILPATVVAYGLATCHGQLMYEHVQWYFPSRGMSFEPQNSLLNLCTGKSSQSSRNSTQSKCASVMLHGSGATPSGEASRIELFGSDSTCAQVRSFIESTPFMAHYDKNTRLASHGWYCGSELTMQLHKVPPQSFECEKGYGAVISFRITPTGA